MPRSPWYKTTFICKKLNAFWKFFEISWKSTRRAARQEGSAALNRASTAAFAYRKDWEPCCASADIAIIATISSTFSIDSAG